MNKTCKYLFLDLGEVKKGKPKDEEGLECTPYKRRELLQKTVIQVGFDVDMRK